MQSKTMPTLFSAFASPFEGPFVDLSENIAKRVFLKTYAKVNQSLADRNSPLRLKFEETTLKNLPNSTVYWRPEVGTLRMALNTADDNVSDTWLVAQFNLYAFFVGALPKFQMRLSTNCPLTVGGTIVRGQNLTLNADEIRLQITNEKGELMLERHRVIGKNDIPLWIADSQADVLHLGSSHSVVIADGSWIDYWSADTPCGTLSNNLSGYRDQLQEVFSFLEDHMTHLYVWSTGLYRETVALAAPGDGGTNSRSFIFCPGQIHFSTSATFVQTLAMVAHECSHQYFHMLLWFLPVVKPGSPEAYSVLKQTSRPLEKILLGFHAFAIVLIALDALKKQPHRSSEKDLHSQFNHVRDYVVSLDEMLQKYAATYLTDTGMEIYQPLRQRCLDIGLL